MKTPYRHIICSLLASCCFSSCKETPPGDDEQGYAMLEQARTLMKEGNNAAARDTILSLRKRFPRAIEARRQAILTLDSVELADATLLQDTLKLEFYRRKLQFDKENKD